MKDGTMFPFIETDGVIHAPSQVEVERTARRAAYARAHKMLDLHELGYAVREYCMPEDEFRFVWHGKRYLTTSKGQQFSDTVLVQGETCIQYDVLKNCGELA